MAKHEEQSLKQKITKKVNTEMFVVRVVLKLLTFFKYHKMLYAHALPKIA